MGIDVGRDILGPAIGAGISGAIGYQGQSNANQANKQIAAAQMKFQERMSSTAYQRAVRDMRAAGLNPALAYQQGGSSSPGGASAHMESTTQEAARAIGGVASTALQSASVRSEMVQRGAETLKAIQEAKTIEAMRKPGIAEVKGRTALLGAQTNTEGEKPANLLAERRKLNLEGDTLMIGNDYLESQLKRKVLIDALNMDYTRASTRAANASAALDEYELPGARNQARSENTKWGRYVRHYLPDAGKVFGLVGDAAAGIGVGKYLGSFGAARGGTAKGARRAYQSSRP